MGRQAYMNRLALGRSPYEAPEPSSLPSGGPSRGRVSSLDGDDYVQQYDSRGHSINPASKSLGRELRRAKNDVLSTMGIVVSGEAGSSKLSREKQKGNLLTAENDYGLILATFDQVSNFLGSWWTLSLGGRIQTFKSYTYVPLLRLIRVERQLVGLTGFYFAGVPAWASAFALSIGRNHLLEPCMTYLQNRVLNLSDNMHFDHAVQRTFSILNTAIRLMLFSLFEQTYMFGILQALHLISPSAIPGIRFFIPFNESSLVQLPPLPNDLSLSSLSRFALGLATAPYTLVYVYVFLRPIVEVRMYRILRRQLPRPDQPDELSIQVAVENDIIEWTVPTLGRRSDEEVRRSSFTMIQEMRYELLSLRNWIYSWFGHKYENQSDGEAINPSRRERIDSLRHRIEQLQHELGNTRSRMQASRIRQRRSLSLSPREERLGDTRAPEPGSGSPGPTVSTQTPDPESLFNMAQVLANEGLTHSPAEITPNTLDGMPPLGRTAIDGVERPAIPPDPSQTLDQESSDDILEHHLNSRSNTLFSRSSSPESSPPTSPRVRASLVHQNSEVITMQLELLSNRNPNRDRDSDAVGNNHNSQIDRRASLNQSASELVDSVLHTPDQSINDTLYSARAGEDDAHPNTTADASTVSHELVGSMILASIEQPLGDVSNENTVVPLFREQTTILPDTVEEPAHSPSRNDGHNNPVSDSESEYSADAGSRPLASRTGRHRRRASVAGPKEFSHRVTVLSSHPVDTLASHLASLITSVLLIPLESLYLRSLAMAYLSSPAASASGRNLDLLRSDIRGLNPFGGGGSRQDFLAYMGKMAIITGMQAAVSVGILRVGSAAALGLGKRLFNWGNL